MVRRIPIPIADFVAGIGLASPAATQIGSTPVLNYIVVPFALSAARPRA